MSFNFLNFTSFALFLSCSRINSTLLGDFSPSLAFDGQESILAISFCLSDSFLISNGLP